MITDEIIAMLKSILSTTPERWQQLVDTVPHELLTRQPAPGEWSALECLHHLVDGERLLFPHRIRQIQASPGLDLDGFDPNFYEYPKENPAELVAAFSRYRQENLLLLEQIS